MILKRKRANLPLLGFGCLLLSLLQVTIPTLAWANEKEKEPAILQADILSYDEKEQTVTAMGHVEIAQGAQILRADRVIYHQDTGIVNADGGVTLLQQSGDVLFTDQAALTSDLADGFVDSVGLLFSDNSRLAASTAHRYQGRYLVVQNGIYTACNVCKDSSTDPLWSLRAKRITHDNLKKNVIYRDATLEFDGVPVFFTPYFSHPDPSVVRRQGFLAPSAGNSSNLGTFARIPYYFDISPDNDLTVSPTFSSKDKAQVSLDWRNRTSRTKMEWQTSFTSTDLVNDSGVDEGETFRGHLFGKVQYTIDNRWRAGSDIALTTDKSYLSRYNIAHDDVLVNKGYLENFIGRDYAAANVYYFEDLRPGTQLAEPLIAPQLVFSRLGEPGKAFGGRWSLDGSFLMTERDQNVNLDEQGPDVRRLSLNSGWKRQLVSQTGLLTELSSFARSDFYYADNVIDSENASQHYNDVTRLRPYTQADITFRYPLGRRGDGYQQLVEPIAQLTAAPRVPNDTHIPNEESLDAEFDETNLFSENRFTGLDKIEGGMRGAYGIRQSLVTDSGGRVELLTGQVFRFAENNTFDQDSSLHEKMSSYVGRLDFVPNPWVDMNYGFLFDKDTFSPEKQSINASAGVSAFRPFVNYLSIDQAIVDNVVTPLKEVTGGFNSTLWKYYTFTVKQNRSFEPDSAVRYTNLSANYKDECFQFGVTVMRNNTQRVDLAGGNSIVFHFYLRNIGGIETDSATNSPYAER